MLLKSEKNRVRSICLSRLFVRFMYYKCMPTLTQEDIDNFNLVSKKTLYRLRQTIKHLEIVASELDIWSTQRAEDIRRGVIRINNEDVSLEIALHRVLVEHYPMSYIDNIKSLLTTYNKTRPVLSKWLLARSFMETIYDRSKISLCDFEAVAPNQVAKVKRYRMLNVLDYLLSMATHINDRQWIDQYLSMRSYVETQDTTKESDLRLFPQTIEEIRADVNRGKRVQLFSDLSKVFQIQKPPEYRLIYESTSRLNHANPLQVLINERVSTQWRERFLLHGMFIKSSIELLSLIENDVELSTQLKNKNTLLTSQLEEFLDQVLKPAWRQASIIELG